MFFFLNLKFQFKSEEEGMVSVGRGSVGDQRRRVGDGPRSAAQNGRLLLGLVAGCPVQQSPRRLHPSLQLLPRKTLHKTETRAVPLQRLVFLQLLQLLQTRLHHQKDQSQPFASFF